MVVVLDSTGLKSFGPLSARPKIIRPAGVWITLVTVIGTS